MRHAGITRFTALARGRVLSLSMAVFSLVLKGKAVGQRRRGGRQDAWAMRGYPYDFTLLSQLRSMKRQCCVRVTQPIFALLKSISGCEALNFSSI